MEYRTLPHGGESISILGLGTSSIGMAGEKEIRATVELALEQGINFFDMASADAAPFPVYGQAMQGCRDRVYFQIHFGANYEGGTYGWTTDRSTIERSIAWQLQALRTDYIDFGFLHCIDEESDLEQIENSGVLEYIQQLQKEGVVRHIGLSSHTPRLANRVLDWGVIDLLMFSINPGYDYHHGDYGVGGAGERMELYRRCQAEGVGISVMKAFSGGQLLQEKTSPFGAALTEYQCIQYALDKPGVLPVLPGVRNREDLGRIIKEAFYIARTGRPGPVLIDLPKDVMGELGSAEYPSTVNIRGYKPNTSVHMGQLKKALKMLKKAKKPLFLAGGGVNIARANDVFTEVVNKTNVPVVTTIMGRGAVPTNHPLFIGNLGMHGCYAANMAVGECDLLFSIGTRFNDRITGKLHSFAPNAQIVHIDIDTSSISRNIHVDIPIVADALEAVQKMNEYVELCDTKKWLAQIRKWDEEVLPLQPQRA